MTIPVNSCQGILHLIRPLQLLAACLEAAVLAVALNPVPFTASHNVLAASLVSQEGEVCSVTPSVTL